MDNMRKKIEDKIKTKEKQIQEWESNINGAREYIKALQEVMRLTPKGENEKTRESKIRPNSSVGKTLAYLKKMGKPMHVEDILVAIGKTKSHKDKMALSGSLGWYVRNHEVFIRSAPNTFGLMTMGNTQNEEPPDNFGVDENKETVEENEPINESIDESIDIEPF